MGNESLRPDFEAWAGGELGYDLSRSEPPFGEVYADLEVQSAWVAVQWLEERLAGGEPKVIREWREARAKSVETAAAYAKAIEAARRANEVKGFGYVDVNPEFQAMTAASNAAYRLSGAALDALYAWRLPESVAAPMSLADQVRDDQRAVTGWSEEKRASVKLEGQPLGRQRDGE
jgi:hypothetical protein